MDIENRLKILDAEAQLLQNEIGMWSGIGTLCFGIWISALVVNNILISETTKDNFIMIGGFHFWYNRVLYLVAALFFTCAFLFSFMYKSYLEDKRKGIIERKIQLLRSLQPPEPAENYPKYENKYFNY